MSAVDVSQVSKVFKIPHEKKTTLYENIVGLFKETSSYERMWALKDISFAVEKGEALGIIGENGSGKSTILKILAGVLQPTSGKIKVDGRVSCFLELGAGLRPDLTARENVFLYGAIMGFTRGEIKERFNDIIKFAELEKFVDTKLKNFSSGMYMRLAFATAINVDPDILIIDEVFAVGDEAFQHKCKEKILEFKKQDKTILFVSHGMDAVKMLCDKAIWLDEGKVAAIGNTAEVVEGYLRKIRRKEKHNVEDDIKELKETVSRLQGESQKKIQMEEKLKFLEANLSKLSVFEDDIFWINRRNKSTQEILSKCTLDAEITGVRMLNQEGVASSRVNAGEDTKLVVNIKFNKDVSNPVLGFTVKDKHGRLVYDTNTMWQKIRAGDFKKGEEVEIEYKQRINMLSGTYYVSTAIASESASCFLDWKDNILAFDVLKTDKSQGLVNLDSQIVVIHGRQKA